jgi:hypothetical protein
VVCDAGGFVARLDNIVGYDFVKDSDGFGEGVVVVAEGEEEGFYLGSVKESSGLLEVRWWSYTGQNSWRHGGAGVEVVGYWQMCEKVARILV